AEESCREQRSRCEVNVLNRDQLVLAPPSLLRSFREEWRLICTTDNVKNLSASLGHAGKENFPNNNPRTDITN
ncbi:hypothetical protein DNTS_014166, partial [Danionella cerebrum]